MAFLSSCDLTDNPAIEGSNTEAMAGEWYLQLMDAVDSTLYVDYSLATTSNTAANVADKMWFNDGAHIFDYQCLINTNQAALTFSATAADNLNFSSTHNPPAAKPVVALGTTKSVLSATPEKMTIEGGSISKIALHHLLRQKQIFCNAE